MESNRILKPEMEKGERSDIESHSNEVRGWFFWLQYHHLRILRRSEVNE
jgi:hypothetical protein